MSIRFVCPNGHRLVAMESKAGGEVRCPRCKQTVTVPQIDKGAPERLPAVKKSKPSRKRGSIPPPLPPRQRPPPVVSKPKPPEISPATRRRTPAKLDDQPEDRPKTESERKPEPPPVEPKGRSSRRRGRRDRKRVKAEKAESTDQGQPTPNGRKTSEPEPPPRPRRRKRPRGHKVMPPDVYQADRGRITTVRWLALFLLVAVIFSVLPVLYHAYQMQLSLMATPGWARIVVLMAMVQLFYIAWMVNRPDFASVWVLMVLFALVSTLYAVGTALVISWPLGEPVPLGMEEIIHSAGTWCFCVLLVMCLATYLCGRVSGKWRRSAELELAGKVKR